MKAQKNEPSFEEMLEELEGIVTKMEAGGLALEETVALYEKGAALEKQLQKRIELTRQRVTVLMDKTGETREEPFEE